MADDPEVPMLDGRVVELRQVGIGVALDANEIRDKTGDKLRAAFVVLAASAHWADTGEKVFADLKAVEAWPMHDLSDVVDLAYAAADANRSKRIRTNGAGEVAFDHPH